MEFVTFFFFFISGVGISWYLFFKFHLQGKYILLEEYTKLDKEKYLLENQLQTQYRAFQKLESDFLSVQEKKSIHFQDLLLTKKEVEILKQKIAENEQNQEENRIRMQEQFELLSNKIFYKNTQNLSKLHTDNLGFILNPLKEKIETFEKKVDESHKSQMMENNVLKHEIKRLADLNLQIGEDAKNLTQALKGDNKSAGLWGEVVLERILETSGLQKDKEYVLQGKNMSLKNEEGSQYKPDVVILLPDKKHLIIDSKVSLKAYEAYTRCNIKEEKAALLKLHITSIKSHIKGLSEKYYQSLSSLNTPDFVLLFLPVEACFSVAFESDSIDLFSYAWEKKVVIVSPTTLFATLRTVASIWKYENQNLNALQIAEESGKLYDKLYSFVEDMDKVGKGISTSQMAFENAYKKLSYGKGNIISRAEKMKSMGINSKKSLDKIIGQIDLKATISGEEDKQYE